MARVRTRKRSKKKYPIEHWSHSSLVAYLRNPLAWYKRYVAKVYDTPATPASVVGRSGHVALEHFYSGAAKDVAIRLGLEYLRAVPDFEIDFGRHTSARAMKLRRLTMEREFLQAIEFYLRRPPKHKVLGAEVRGVVAVEGLPLPLKAISDLVVESKGNPGTVDIVDHKFVASFSSAKSIKPIFMLQAIFNYYTVSALYGRPIRRFIVYECKKTRNADGASQLRRHVIEYEKHAEDFIVFRRLIQEATAEIATRRTYLPNPSDMFEGEISFEVYRLGLVEE